jgi:hypothetical protein
MSPPAETSRLPTTTTATGLRSPHGDLALRRRIRTPSTVLLRRRGGWYESVEHSRSSILSMSARIISADNISTPAWFISSWVLTSLSWAAYFGDHALLGLVLALLLVGHQAWTLRKIVRPADWFGASAIGQVLLCIGVTLSFWSRPPFAELILVTFAASGAALQWMAVRRIASNAPIWFLATVALGVGHFLGYILCKAFDLRSVKAALTFGAAGGVAAATAATITLLICLAPSGRNSRWTR